jgi:putative aldouronate transport system substrate-binding protein
MLAIVAACGDDSAPTTTAPAADTGEAAAPADTETPADTTPAPDGHDPSAFQQPPAGGWDVPFEYPVLITTVANSGTNWNFLEGDDVNNNPWTRLYKERLNIEVYFEWTTPDEYVQRLNLAIAAGQLPDVFHIPPAADPRLFYELVDEGLLLDLTDAFNNYASADVQRSAEMDPGTKAAFTVNGRIYGIPRYYYGPIDQPWHIWIRQDWYQAEGSPEIRTVDDLENLARAFMQNHGAKAGIAAASNLQWLLRMAPMWGAYIGDLHDNQYFWVRNSAGRIIPGIAMPEFKDALAAYNRWYEEGLIDPDFMSLQVWGNADEEIRAGLVGIMCFWQWWGWHAWQVIDAVGSDEAVYYPYNLPTVSGATPARGQLFWGNQGVVVASADFQNPAALMKLLSLTDHMMFTAEANLSEEDIYYFMDDGREHTISSSFIVLRPGLDLQQYEYVLHALETGDSSNLFTTGMKSKYFNSLRWINDRHPPALGEYLQMGFAGSAYARAQYLFDNNFIIQSELWGPAPAEFALVANSADILMENIPLIIMGIEPLSHWDWVLEQWYAQGGQILEDAMNAMYG